MTAEALRFRFDAHIGYMFTDLPLEQRVAAAARAGFRGVEHPNPYDLPAPQMARLLEQAGTSFLQLALPTGDPALGGKGIAIFADQREAFRKSVETALDYAEQVGCRIIHPMAGIRPSGADFDRLWDVYLENLAYAAAAADRAGVSVVIEPIGPGTIADYFIADPLDALRAVEAVGAPNLRLMLDVFHLANAGHDPASFVARHGAKIGHVQIADVPGRHEPGTGTIDFEAVFGALADAGYAGFIGCEYIPAGETEAGLGWLPRWNL